MQISRAELYQLVWESPLSRIAPQFGITATALAGVCKKHLVPYPGSGHWTRKSLGLPVELVALPEVADPIAQIIEIEPAKRRIRTENTPAKVAKNPGVAEVAPHAVASAPKVLERVSKQHPIIAKWLADHDRRRREATSSRDPWRIRSAPPPLSDIDQRRHRILDALFKTLEARGAKIAEAEKGLQRATIDGEKIDFQIREKNKQVRVSAEDRRSSYRSQELVGTGKLVLAIRTYLRGPHNEEWLETEKNPLEQQLPQIVDRFFEGAAILRAWHVEQELEREQRRQEAARRADVARLLKQEENRRQRLCELAGDWQTAQLLRRLADAIKQQPHDPETVVGEKSLGQWLAWIEATIDALDPTFGGAEKLFSIIESVKVDKAWNE